MGESCARNVYNISAAFSASFDIPTWATGAVLTGIALWLVGSIGTFFARLVQCAVSREREFLADAASAQFTRNPEGLANALRFTYLADVVGGGRAFGAWKGDVSHMLFASTGDSLFETHPPVKERIRRLSPRGETAADESVKSRISAVKERRRAMAKAANATGTILNTLFHRAIAVGKNVRTETKIAYNSVSVSSAAVELAAEKLGGLKDKTALIFGAGKMAQLTAQHLKSHGVKKILVANHHIERALEMAEKIGGEAVPWENAIQRALDVDIIITSTGAPHYVIKPWQTQQLMTRRAGRGIFFIDIAVPRDVDPEVGKIGGVTLYNIDDLEAVVESHVKARQLEAEEARKIIEVEVAAMTERFKYLKFQPLMADLSDRAEKIRERELKRISGKIPNLTDEERRALDQMTKKIVRKLLRLPMMKLNASAGTSQENFYAAAMQALFRE